MLSTPSATQLSLLSSDVKRQPYCCSTVANTTRPKCPLTFPTSDPQRSFFPSSCKPFLRSSLFRFRPAQKVVWTKRVVSAEYLIGFPCELIGMIFTLCFPTCHAPRRLRTFRVAAVGIVTSNFFHTTNESILLQPSADDRAKSTPERRNTEFCLLGKPLLFPFVSTPSGIPSRPAR